MSLKINVATGTNTVNGVKGKTDDKRANQPNMFSDKSIGESKSAIDRKREAAKEKAFGVIKAAWDNDLSIDKSLDEMREHAKDMVAQMKNATEEVENNDEEMRKLKDIYEVSPKEDDELNELIGYKEKQKDGTILSDEEKQRIQELEGSKTEYQTRAMELYDRKSIAEDLLDKATKNLVADIANITSVKIERLKSNAMGEANKQADAIMEENSKEIMGLIINDAKENVDKASEEAKEKEDKAKEEKKEKEEANEKIELKRAIEQALTLGTKEAIDKVKKKENESNAPDDKVGELIDDTTITKGNSDVSKSLQDVKNSMKLLEADLKGVKVDESL